VVRFSLITNYKYFNRLQIYCGIFIIGQHVATVPFRLAVTNSPDLCTTNSTHRSSGSTLHLLDEHSWGQLQQTADAATSPGYLYEHLHAVAFNNTH